MGKLSSINKTNLSGAAELTFMLGLQGSLLSHGHECTRQRWWLLFFFVLCSVLKTSRIIFYSLRYIHLSF
ncbi:hypothetical protein Peur_060246 [Populus x canadensis]